MDSNSEQDAIFQSINTYSEQNTENDYLYIPFEDCFFKIFGESSKEIDKISLEKLSKDNEIENLFRNNLEELISNEAKNKINQNESDCIICKNEDIFKKKKIKDFKIFKEGSKDFSEIVKNAKIIKKNPQFSVSKEILQSNSIKIQLDDDSENKVTITTKKKINRKSWKIKKKRKFKPDEIRKKIKSRFHKSLTNIINLKLKNAGSQEFFGPLPQCFLCNITIELNKEVMNLTYRQLLEKDFTKHLKDQKSKQKANKAKHERNLKVLKYLDKHEEISKKSGFDDISNMAYADILREYFLSEEFEFSVKKLKLEKENDEYINEYMIKSRTYVNFFLNYKEISMI